MRCLGGDGVTLLDKTLDELLCNVAARFLGEETLLLPSGVDIISAVVSVVESV
jgi:hypothetical protein